MICKVDCAFLRNLEKLSGLTVKAPDWKEGGVQNKLFSGTRYVSSHGLVISSRLLELFLL